MAVASQHQHTQQSQSTPVLAAVLSVSHMRLPAATSYLITSHQRQPCRERYRKAAELSRVRGKLSCLLINDLDAGLGHFANTQVTVNNQVRSPPPRFSPPVGYLRPSVHASDFLSDKTGSSAGIVCHQVSLAELMCTIKHCPWVWV